MSDEAGSKQLQATFLRLNIQLAFTGVAIVSGRRTIDWLLGELQALPLDSDLEGICDALAKRSAAEMKRIRPRGMLTLVLSAAAARRPFRVAVISNVQWSEDPPVARDSFKVQIRPIRKRFKLISGYRQSVGLLERSRLEAFARAVDRKPKQILDALAEINEQAASNGGGYISKGCWVAAQFADGDLRRTETHNVGDREGSVGQLFVGMDVFEWIKKNFRAEPGKQLRLSPLGGVIVGPGG